VYAGVAGRRLQAKLKVHDDGRFEFQESGLRTWFNRQANDSLTSPLVYRAVANVFEECRNLLKGSGDPGHQAKLFWKMLYGLRGYHTLVKEGYPTVREHVVREGSLTKRLLLKSDKLGMPLRVGRFDQLPFTNGTNGLCWGFTMDWLRRCFQSRFFYNQTKAGFVSSNVVVAKVKKKVEGHIQATQQQQLTLKRTVHGGIAVVHRGGMITSYTHVPGTSAPVDGTKFAGMTLLPHLPIVNIAPAQQRFYGNVNTLQPQPSPFAVLSAAMPATWADKTQGIGWVIAMGFADFWTGLPGIGHAVGVFWTSKRKAVFFDPNLGYDTAVNGFLSHTDAWLEKIVQYYSMTNAVTDVLVYPVTYTPTVDAIALP